MYKHSLYFGSEHFMIL